MLSSFNDEDAFRQFEDDRNPHQHQQIHQQQQPSNPNLRQKVSKGEILDILSIVEASLTKTWSVSCGGRKKKLKKLEKLEELKSKIESCPDDMNLSMVMDNVAAPTSCVPPLFGRHPSRIIERQLSSTLHFLDEHMNQGEDEINNATISQSFAEDDEELEMMTAISHVSSEASSVYTNSVYDINSEKETAESSRDGLSGGTEDDVVVTTCNIEDNLGPLGVSITTWNRRKLNEESMRSRSAIAAAIEEAENTHDSDEEDNSNDNDCERSDEGSLEEVSVAIGKFVVHASRTRSVRFSGVKPSTEDNINRAMELLQNAKRMRENMS
jgi:hypothetical protein